MTSPKRVCVGGQALFNWRCPGNCACGAHKQKTPQLQAISLSQWMGASMKILNVRLVQNRMEMGALQDYLAYTVKISELIEDHTWQSVILYDNEYRKLQHRHQFRWGSDSQHF